MGIEPPQSEGTAALSERTKLTISEIARKYGDPRSAVLPALYAAQAQFGYVPEEALAEIAEILQLTRPEVGSVASFYRMFYKRPTDKHIISVCSTLSCALLGAEHLLEYLSEKLGVQTGETTPDGLFSLHEVECLGYCDHAPAMMIDDKYYGNLIEEKLDEILRELGWEGPSGAAAISGIDLWKRED